jgi:hypothetical protein
MAICNFNNVTLRTSRCTAINTAVGTSGNLLFYTGSPPADASVAATGTLLATLPCSATFGAVTTGVTGGAKPYLTANAITSANGVASGTPGYCRLQTSAGVGVVDLDVGTSGTSVIATPDTITSGAPVNVTSLVITEA